MWNSTNRSVINSSSIINRAKVKVLLYALCVEAISVLHMEKMISIDTRTLQRISDICSTTTKKVTNFDARSTTANLDQKVVTAEVLFSGFLVKYNLPLSTADHAVKLFRNMFPDSKIMNKYRCGRTKTTHILTGAVAKQITSDLKRSYC